MLNVKTWLRFFEKDFLLKILFLLLLYSLIPLGEIFFLLYLGGKLGNYLTLALAATTGFIGVFMAVREVQHNLILLKQKIKDGDYPGKEFINLAGILTGGILLLTPGFFTDFFGFLFFLPVFRNFVGRVITRRLKSKLSEVYEYLKLYDLE